MVEPIQNKIKRSFQAGEGLYYRLVLLVGEIGSGKTGVLRDVADEFGTEVINVNRAISSELLELKAKQRILRLPEILDRVASKAQRMVVLDNLEILFDKELGRDPLRLLQNISRHRSIIASWSGTIQGDKLIYAEIGHSEYRSYDLLDTLIVSMDGTATIDSEKDNRK